MGKIIQNKEIVVSIICDTFCHEKYIAQCLDSLIKQKTNFAYEILVHDDASTDNTGLIIKDYAKRYPDLIKPIVQNENKYSQGISIWLNFQIPRIKGKYIALCEGDDYWLDSNKLQSQVDFLESNPGYGLVYGKAKVFKQNTGLFTGCIGEPCSTFEELINENKIPTLTVLFRYDLFFKYFEDVNPEIRGWKMGDYPLWLYISHHSKIMFMDQIFSVYRVLDESASHSSDCGKTLQFINSTSTVRSYFSERYGYDMYNAIETKRVLEIFHLISYHKAYGLLSEVQSDMNNLFQHTKSPKLYFYILLSKFLRLLKGC